MNVFFKSDVVSLSCFPIIFMSIPNTVEFLIALKTTDLNTLGMYACWPSKLFLSVFYLEAFLGLNQFLLRVFRLHRWYLFWHKPIYNLSIWQKISKGAFSLQNIIVSLAVLCFFNDSLTLYFFFNKSVFRAIFSRSALRIAFKDQ